MASMPVGYIELLKRIADDLELWDEAKNEAVISARQEKNPAIYGLLLPSRLWRNPWLIFLCVFCASLWLYLPAQSASSASKKPSFLKQWLLKHYISIYAYTNILLLKVPLRNQRYLS